MRQSVFYFVCVIWSIGSCYAQKMSDERANTPIPFTLADRDRLIELSIAVKELDKRMTDQFNMIQKQFEYQQKQFEYQQKQLEYQQKQLDEQRTEIHWVIGLIITLMGLVIGLITYIIWDRKTIIKPLERKMERQMTESRQERNKLQQLIRALQELSKTDERVAAVLKQFNLL
ncbi:MAG: hypothetical protein D6799_07590 [Bacteroidetes bacterium]|nr:MAG: hypothetical protein D6799_07590 [Bacteroidota bacterium]